MGVVNKGVLRTEEKICVFRCTACAQELWHYYDISASPLCAAEVEGISPICQPGSAVQPVTHRQRDRYLKAQHDRYSTAYYEDRLTVLHKESELNTSEF